MQRILGLGAAVWLAALVDLQAVTGSTVPQQIPFSLPHATSPASHLPQSHLKVLDDDQHPDERLVRLTLSQDPIEASKAVQELEVSRSLAGHPRRTIVLNLELGCWLRYLATTAGVARLPNTAYGCHRNNLQEVLGRY